MNLLIFGALIKENLKSTRTLTSRIALNTKLQHHTSSKVLERHTRPQVPVQKKSAAITDTKPFYNTTRPS